jgi:hypothetical protein
MEERDGWIIGRLRREWWQLQLSGYILVEEEVQRTGQDYSVMNNLEWANFFYKGSHNEYVRL